jgi:hypothetical protein
MTETISEDTRYGYDDLEAGDVVEVTRISGGGTVGEIDKIVGTVSAQHRYGTQPQIITVFGIFDANRTTDRFRLLKRKPALPDTPGTVGLATINGRRLRVMLVQDGSGSRIWVCASPSTAEPVRGIYLAADEALHDFKLLDVYDPETGKRA